MKFLFMIFWVMSISSAFATAEGKVPSRLLGYLYDANGVTFQLAYGGCLDQASIEFSKVQENGLTKVTMLQNEDVCELNAPFGITIKKTYAQMGLSGKGVFQFTNQAIPITIFGANQTLTVTGYTILGMIF